MSEYGRTYACATSTKPTAVIVFDSQVIFGVRWPVLGGEKVRVVCIVV